MRITRSLVYYFDNLFVLFFFLQIGATAIANVSATTKSSATIAIAVATTATTAFTSAAHAAATDAAAAIDLVLVAARQLCEQRRNRRHGRHVHGHLRRRRLSLRRSVGA